MIFNSFEFLLFLPLVWCLYWLLNRNLRLQNLLVVVASYVFYGWWDWRFLVLIAFTSGWSYVVGVLELNRWDRKPSRLLLTMSLLVNLGILGYFKYFNFFLESFVAFAEACLPEALVPHMTSLRIILPVGISFYTFQALSYTIDVYRRQIRPTRDPIAFFAFISFFPQLVAGPIERATNLLPQFQRGRRFEYPAAVLGCRQMLWGFFKKMVVADNCAVAANFLLNDPAMDNGVGAIVGVFFFAMQVYGDFSGYSDIAIGCSRLFGVNLMTNFAFPLFSRSIPEFWRRWHISLMGWIRDYLYIPLGGNRCSRPRQVLNMFVIFFVSGLWHGANWTFVCWGLLHAMLFLPCLLFLKRGGKRTMDVVAQDRALPTFREFGCVLGTFFLVQYLPNFIFRAQNIAEAWRWLSSAVDISSYAILELPHESRVAYPMMAIMMAVEWINRREAFGFVRFPKWVWLRWACYLAVVVLILLYAPGSQSFIYFQF